YAGITMIFGEEVASAMEKIYASQAPDPATVKIIPNPEFYFGVVIIIIGLIMAIIGGALKKNQPQSQAPPQQPYASPLSRDGYRPPPPRGQEPYASPGREQEPPPYREKYRPPPPSDYDFHPSLGRDTYRPPPSQEFHPLPALGQEAYPNQARQGPTPPPPPPSQQSYPCNYCRQPMRYVNEYQKWYCDYCGRYG
ncbi:MAG: hypothetical protein ACFFG0_35935, partial [Candidatus Thorarchaeota archaeon]